MQNKKIIITIIIVFLTGFFLLMGNIFPQEKTSPENEIKVKEKNLAAEIFNNNLLTGRKMGIAPPDIEAKAVYSVYYNKKGAHEILFSRGRLKKLPIASITKLMTALVVYENYDLNSPIGIPDLKLFSNVHLKDLRIFSDTTYREILYPLLLESNNSGAYAVAVAPDNINFNDFVRMMNNKAEEIGMKRTIFYNPSGLDNTEGINLSTAYDVSLLVERLLEIPLFWEIMQQKSYDIYSKKTDLYYRITTTNHFLDNTYFQEEKPDWYSDILGGKTGFTYQAMGCLVMVLEPDDNEYLINIILGANGYQERFEEMEKLIDWIYQAYKI